ncbi:hypothetical protein S7711_11097 [Stachybotrys chartarum IBT 7711]|uniref:Uncharacterized protein n=1 Tax=Stachybotrys chartarum (strain CBS 109288 / IBT 7711) TaxID=1280523 RepID=A0A084ARX5_STACB|nr:hypothetical protein S7711_11097 [Stachybotrys chartarum IBT 7711]KFA70807.1 hypothetical protein S40288_11571 [Stachybotrys chartarum IBT 40288]
MDGYTLLTKEEEVKIKPQSINSDTGGWMCFQPLNNYGGYCDSFNKIEDIKCKVCGKEREGDRALALAKNTNLRIGRFASASTVRYWGHMKSSNHMVPLADVQPQP